MKIDIFSHIMPQKYNEELRKRSKIWWLPGYYEKAETGADISRQAPRSQLRGPIGDVDSRLRLLERYPDVLNVLTVTLPPLEAEIVDHNDAVELARMANDEMAELVAKYPDKFVAAVACLPLTDIGAAIEEADRAIDQLGFRGVQIFTGINWEPLDSPKFRPLYQRMEQHDLPIWIHPWGQPTSATGKIPYENTNPNPIRGLGWPFETTVAMGALVRGGIFRDCPNIKFITHHCGGMIPFFHRRIVGPGGWGMGLGVEDTFRNFYADTAIYGNTAGLMCGYDFFGVDHLLFGTDAPLGPGGKGPGYTMETIRAIERMDIPDIDKEKIFIDNAKKLLKLPL